MPVVSKPKAALRWGAAFVFSGLLLAAPATPARQAPDDDDVVALVVSREAFRPDTLRGRKGDTLRVRVSTTDGEHCLAVDELRIEKRLLPGKPLLLELTPDRSGTFDIYCCLDPADARGRLIVAD